MTTSPATPAPELAQRQQQRPTQPALAPGPLYAFSLPVSLQQGLRTLQSPLNDPLPSHLDIIANPASRPYSQTQAQRAPQKDVASVPGAPALSIRFPKARPEGASASAATSSAAEAATAHSKSEPAEDGDDSEDDLEDAPAAYASIGAGPNAPFIWIDSADSALQQQQFGVHRSLFTLPPSRSGPVQDPDDFPVNHLKSLQLPPITRPRGVGRAAVLQNQHRGGVFGITGRTLKAQGVQEAARRLGFRVLEGQGYIAGLGKVDSGIDEDGESTDEEVAGAAGTDGTDEGTPAVLSREQSDNEAAGGEDDLHSTAPTTTSQASTTLTPLQAALFSSPELKTWTVILLGGGHFAAAVIALNPFYEVSPKLFPNGPPTSEQLLSIATSQAGTDRSVLLLAHKTIHRYTTRRKQGGSQSTQDASGKFAKSAGAQLRRYGEQSLREEIRATLSSPGWRKLLAQTDRVWVRAGARAASGVLWNWPSGESPLDVHRENDTIVSVPVQTRKPTLGECVRIWADLCRLRVRSWTSEQLAALEEEVRLEREKGRAAVERRNRAAAAASTDATQKTAAAEAKRRKTVVLSDRERTGRDRFTRMVDMVRKGKVDLLVDFLAKYEDELVKRGGGWGPSEGDAEPDAASGPIPSIDTPLPTWWRAQEAGIPIDELFLREGGDEGDGQAHEVVPTSVPSTLLQLAAEAGSEDIVQYLLIERRANPTLPVLPFVRRSTTSSPAGTTAPHRTAYDLTSARGVRDVFRRLMAEQPDWYDWAGMGAGGARVPSALTGEMEEKREGKAKERRNLMREKARAREAAAAASGKGAQPEMPAEAPAPAPVPEAPKPSSSVSNRLGGGSGGANAPSALRQAIDQQAGVTPEMRARIEREKRARAAEARLKGIAGGSV